MSGQSLASCEVWCTHSLARRCPPSAVITLDGPSASVAGTRLDVALTPGPSGVEAPFGE